MARRHAAAHRRLAGDTERRDQEAAWLRLNGRAFAARGMRSSRAAVPAWNAQARLMASLGDAMLLRW